ncbi:MAG: hypothetical protein H7039_24880 [Bryobacteraceae bacterium]|nr:hypothetical protein [Bryobacteraceae bacterium]
MDHKENTVHCEGTRSGEPAEPCSFSVGGVESRNKGREWTVSTKAKWEGSAILVNSIAMSNQRRDTQLTLMDQWKLSRDAQTLKIRRVCVTLYGEKESTLVYERQAQP